MKQLSDVITKIAPKGPTFDQINSFYNVLPSHIQSLVRVSVSEDDDEVGFDILHNNQHFVVIFNLDSDSDLYATWLTSDCHAKIIPGETCCVALEPDTYDRFKNAVIAWFNAV